jgi:hypothetical protein
MHVAGGPLGILLLRVKERQPLKWAQCCAHRVNSETNGSPEAVKDH